MNGDTHTCYYCEEEATFICAECGEWICDDCIDLDDVYACYVCASFTPLSEENDDGQ